MSDPKEPSIRLASCRSDGRCPECGISTPGSGGLLPALCGCRVCGPGCWSMHERRLLIEALRQRDLQADNLAELRVKHQQKRDGPHIMVHRQLWDQMKEERDAALRKGAAERAMLDEILALPDIEAPAGDGSENVASVVASALEALREERDAAIREAASRYDCHGGPGTATEPCGACVSCVMRRAEKAERERDEARAQLVDLAHGYALDITASRALGKLTLERADRAEALLREIQPMVVQAVLDPYPVVRERASALLAKIREVLGAK